MTMQTQLIFQEANCRGLPLGVANRLMRVIPRLDYRLTEVAYLAVASKATRAGNLAFPCKPDGYLLGSYRIATTPEPNSNRLTSFKSMRFDSPANNVGPWPASLGCTKNSYSSINPSSANASGSFTPPMNSPLPDSRLSCWTAFPRSPRTSSAFQSTRSMVRDTTYFFAALIVRAKGSIQSGLAPAPAGGRNATSIIS